MSQLRFKTRPRRPRRRRLTSATWLRAATPSDEDLPGTSWGSGRRPFRGRADLCEASWGARCWPGLVSTLGGARLPWGQWGPGARASLGRPGAETLPQARGSGSGCPSRSSELTRRPDRCRPPRARARTRSPGQARSGDGRRTRVTAATGGRGARNVCDTRIMPKTASSNARQPAEK